LLCKQVRERMRVGDTLTYSWTSSIPRTAAKEASGADEAVEAPIPVRQARYRPLGDPDNFSLNEAREILGKALKTLYIWYRKGKFPPAVAIEPYLRSTKPVVIVPGYRLDPWQAAARMPSILQEVFEAYGLHEPSWVCYVSRKGASPDDITFWTTRRRLKVGLTKNGKRIYGEGLEEGRVYDLVSIH
jgi:hypothetical protein